MFYARISGIHLNELSIGRFKIGLDDQRRSIVVNNRVIVLKISNDRDQLVARSFKILNIKLVSSCAFGSCYYQKPFVLCDTAAHVSSWCFLAAEDHLVIFLAIAELVIIKFMKLCFCRQLTADRLIIGAV